MRDVVRNCGHYGVKRAGPGFFFVGQSVVSPTYTTRLAVVAINRVGLRRTELICGVARRIILEILPVKEYFPNMFTS